MSFTCKGCGNRQPGCHSHCEKYIAEKAAWEKQQAEIRKQKQIQDGLDSQKYGVISKAAKRRGKASPSIIGGQ